MMKLFTIDVLIFLQICFSFVYSQSKFVTIWTPKFVKENETLYVYHTTKETIDDDVDINIKFQKSGITHTLNEGKIFNEIKFLNTSVVNNKKFWKVNVTLARDNSFGVKMCILKTMSLKTEHISRNIFIQLDKPVYKPGDLIRLRVIVLDNNLKLFHANNIDVSIIDPLGNKYKITDDLSGRVKAVIVESFQLPDETFLGSWRVEVTVERQKSTIKTFSVQKYVLPPFEVVIKTSEKHYHKDYDVKIYFHGRYSFEEYVKGNFEITISKKLTNEQVYKKDIYNDGKVMTLNWKERNFPANVEYLEYEIRAELREPVSGIKLNSTTTFFIHNEQRYKIIVGHSDRFQSNIPFRIKVLVYDWEGNSVKDSTENPDIKIIYTTTNGISSSVYGNPKLINGVATYEVKTLESHLKFEIEASFINSKIYRKVVTKGNQDVSIDGLVVSHTPERPKIGDFVEVIVKSDSIIDKLFVIYTTQRGNVNKRYIKCENEHICKFRTRIDQTMVPSFTVSVHQILSIHQIYKGKTSITTESLGINELTVQLSKRETSPYKNVIFKFNSLNDSEVYVLAFDKRLSYMAKGNDVTSEDIRRAYEDFEGENMYLVIDLNINDQWHQCTEREKKYIAKGKLSAAQHSNTGDTAVEIDDEYNDEDDDDDDDTDFQGGKENKSNVTRVRQEFPETWIFESFDIKGGIEKKIKKRVPDSITSWLISAFAVNSETAIAVANPNELTVKMNFFIKINLPYSIRYKEILQVDVLIYNYVEGSKKLTVDIKLENLEKVLKNGKKVKEFEFVDQQTCLYSKKDSETKSNIEVQERNVKKVSFYIRSNPDDNENVINRNILLQVRANAKSARNNQEFRDAVRNSLLVEQVGIMKHKIQTTIFKLNGETKKATFDANIENDKFPKATVVVSGDQLTENMNLKVNEQSNIFFPEGCAQQRTSRFKGVVEYYRYLKLKNLDTSTAANHLNTYYTKVTAENVISVDGYWKYRRTTGYTAYFTEAFISAVEINAYNLNQNFIETELNYLVGLQQSTGEFKNTKQEFVFPTFDRTRFLTASYFDTAYALIPLLKYNKLLMDRGYNTNSLYKSAINKGFRFLSSQPRANIENDALSMGAYAYALYGENLVVKELFDVIEKASITYPGNKLCYKVKMSASSCDFQHTVYVALAYVARNEISKTEPIINYLLEYHYQNKYYSNTYEYAIATEAIAKVAGVMKSGNTNIILTLKNEHSFSKPLTITNEQSTKNQEVSLPEYSRRIEVEASGYGYCAVSNIFQFRDTTARTIAFFKNSVEVNRIQNTVMICALYDPSLDPDRPLQRLTNVIFEIETPSGYTFVDVINVLDHKEYLRKIESKNMKTLVFLYFDQFDANRRYCVSIQLQKSFPVLNLKQAGIKIYDYDKKDSMAVVFYGMEQGKCASI